MYSHSTLARALWPAVATSALLSLAGCGPGLQAIESQNAFMVSAPALCEDAPGSTPASAKNACQLGNDAGAAESTVTNPASPNKERLGLIINESEHKCGEFLNGLVLAANSSHLGLDGLSTVFGALGTVFTPLSTVHGLTAAGAITSGWRADIDSDIYAKAAVASYAQAIQSTYYADLKTYMDGLASQNDTDIILSMEIAKLRTIHKECGLASAQAAIAATLQPGAAGIGAVSPQLVTVAQGATAAKTKYTLTGTGGSLKTPETITYTTSGAESTDSIAAKLAGQVNADGTLRDAGVTAMPGATGSTSFTVNSPAGITWTVSSNMTVEPATPKPPAAAAAPPGPAAALLLPGGQQHSTATGIGTQSVVPGHAVR
jgi:hypothetical protein